jgi:hypothetical protein
MRSPFLLFLPLLLATLPALGQNTVALTAVDVDRAEPGYTLIFPHRQGNGFLLDNCGRVVHRWDDSLYQPGNGVTLAPNGDLVVCKGRNAVSNPVIQAGGGGERIERRTWEGDLVWSFTYNNDSVRLHHDLALMPNGHVLAIAWERIDSARALNAGRRPERLPEGELWPDQVIEIAPNGSGGADVVWRWRAWDHLVQDTDPLLPDYAAPSARPERIDVNFDTQGYGADWMHANSIDYHPDRDQIALSIPHFNELWIIDHSTTTAEAAGSTGGVSGKGGDLLYRWGNPSAYGRGTPADMRLFFNHDVHWVGRGEARDLDPSHPDFDKLAVFNNRVGADFSQAHLLVPPWNEGTWSYDTGGAAIGAWGPDLFDWTYTASPPESMYSTGLSSIQRLRGSNTLFAVGREGRLFEAAPDGTVVWDYTVPLQSGNPLPQGTPDPPTGANLCFRATRFSPDHPALAGRTLDPIGWIELSPDTTYCTLPEPSGLAQTDAPKLQLWPVPARGRIALRLPGTAPETVRILDAQGRQRHTLHVSHATTWLDLSGCPAGTYMALTASGTARRFVVLP